MDPHARGAWIGLTLAHRRAHLVRALLEGVGFALRDCLLPMRRLGVSPEVLYAVGGGARSDLWRQIVSAMLGVQLQRLAVEEGPALGAALLAGVGAGVHADVAAAVAAAVHVQGPLEAPDQALEARYGELYRGYAALYPALQRSGVW
jgi:xylulokinase